MARAREDDPCRHAESSCEIDEHGLPTVASHHKQVAMGRGARHRCNRRGEALPNPAGAEEERDSAVRTQAVPLQDLAAVRVAKPRVESVAVDAIPDDPHLVPDVREERDNVVSHHLRVRDDGPKLRRRVDGPFVRHGQPVEGRGLQGPAPPRRKHARVVLDPSAVDAIARPVDVGSGDALVRLHELAVPSGQGQRLTAEGDLSHEPPDMRRVADERPDTGGLPIAPLTRDNADLCEPLSREQVRSLPDDLLAAAVRGVPLPKDGDGWHQVVHRRKCSHANAMSRPTHCSACRWTSRRAYRAPPRVRSAPLMSRLSIVVIARNEVGRIGRMLDSVRFADEIIVLDGGSTDGTVAEAVARGARVHVAADWAGFGRQRNRALAHATGEWVLALDCDEWVVPELEAEIRETMRLGRHDAYRIPRASFLCGHRIRHSGWSPDYVVRLFRRVGARFTDDLVHERLVHNGPVGTLRHPLMHETHRSLDEAIAKMNRYSSDSASSLRARGGRGGVAIGLIRATWMFFRTYLLRRGVLDGRDGLVIALLNAENTFWRYAKTSYLASGEGGGGSGPRTQDQPA